MGACATFDLTHACTLRCAHCYHFAGRPQPSALSAETYLARLTALRDAHRLTTAFWVGGEPLLEPELLVRATGLFARNAVATSGLLPVPDGLEAGLLVSLDGLEPEHDRLRGAGTFRRVCRALARRPEGSFALQLTVTAQTLGAIEALPALCEQVRSAGALVSFFTGAPRSPFALDPSQRARAVEQLIELKARRPALLLNSSRSLEYLRRPAELAARCPYRAADLAFDAQLHRKQPCTFGASADCATCGCGVLALRVALSDDDLASHQTLRRLFPRRAVLDLNQESCSSANRGMAQDEHS